MFLGGINCSRCTSTTRQVFESRTVVKMIMVVSRMMMMMLLIESIAQHLCVDTVRQRSSKLRPPDGKTVRSTASHVWSCQPMANHFLLVLLLEQPRQCLFSWRDPSKRATSRDRSLKFIVYLSPSQDKKVFNAAADDDDEMRGEEKRKEISHGPERGGSFVHRLRRCLRGSTPLEWQMDGQCGC